MRSFPGAGTEQTPSELSPFDQHNDPRHRLGRSISPLCSSNSLFEARRMHLSTWSLNARRRNRGVIQ